MTAKKSLLVFRNEINDIDEKIVKLLTKRQALVLQIAKSKIENNQPIRDKEREKKVLKKLIKLGKENCLAPEYITRLFQLIIKESVSNQKILFKEFYKDNQWTPSNFSFLGPKGSYSHIAATEYAKRNFKTCIIRECSTFNEVISSVENSQSDYGVLPIENTCSGSINEVFNLLKKTNLFIVGEINIFINHCLLAIKKIPFNEIQTIYSHPQPFQQCSNFIKQFPQWKIKYTKSTSDAMKKISSYNDIHNAVLGSEIGCEMYGLKILSKNLANQEKNMTRFILLSQNSVKISEKIPAKTTLILSTEKKSSVFDQVLLILNEKKLITKILTACINYKNSLEEIFYIEVQANLSSELMQNALKAIQKITKFVKILGCYSIKKEFSIKT